MYCAQAYKRAALRYHPDKAVADEREEAEKKFKQVGAAHAILSDPAKRQKYDAGLWKRSLLYSPVDGPHRLWQLTAKCCLHVPCCMLA